MQTPRRGQQAKPTAPAGAREAKRGIPKGLGPFGRRRLDLYNAVVNFEGAAGHEDAAVGVVDLELAAF